MEEYVTAHYPQHLNAFMNRDSVPGNKIWAYLTNK